MKSIEIIDGLINHAKSLKMSASNFSRNGGTRDIQGLNKFLARAEMILTNLLGDESPYIKRLYSITYVADNNYLNSLISGTASPYVISDAMDNAWDYGLDEVVILLGIVREEFTLFRSDIKSNIPADNEKLQSNKVFIVHGHNDKMKLSVARSIEKIGLEPIILHEQPNLGKTVIEKIHEYSDVGYAVILLSPDDVGYLKNESTSYKKSRARQNVILELGYFLGKLGRQRVMALYLQDKNFEMPSDFSGVLYIPYDDAGKWKFDLVRELKACGYDVDANKLV